MPPVIILCGGQGTRLREVTELLPKPMVPIGEYPIVWHIMKCYAAFGVRKFILCLGYKQETFIDYFANYRLRNSDLRITLGTQSKIEYLNANTENDWEITLARTGLNTMTGGRVRQAMKYLPDNQREFFLTYGDGVADIDIGKLLDFHRNSGKLLTLSAVHPAARFGKMELDGDTVTGFSEKTGGGAEYINGGYMVVNTEFIGRFLNNNDADCFFEQRPVSEAVAAGETAAYRHEGFWQCMDNPREYALLNNLWRQKRTPWTKYWV